jgi:hypothetical protein
LWMHKSSMYCDMWCLPIMWLPLFSFMLVHNIGMRASMCLQCALKHMYYVFGVLLFSVPITSIDRCINQHGTTFFLLVKCSLKVKWIKAMQNFINKNA